MAERPEDLNLPNAVITRIIKEAVGAGPGAAGRPRAGTASPGRSPGSPAEGGLAVPGVAARRCREHPPGRVAVPLPPGCPGERSPGCGAGRDRPDRGNLPRSGRVCRSKAGELQRD